MSKISRGQKGEEKAIAVLNKIKEYHHLLNNVDVQNAHLSSNYKNN